MEALTGLGGLLGLGGGTAAALPAMTLPGTVGELAAMSGAGAGMGAGGLGLGGLAGAAGSMIPGAGPVIGGVSTLADLMGGVAMPTTFKEAFMTGMKLGGTMKDVMGAGGGGAAPAKPPVSPVLPPTETPGGPTPAMQAAKNAGGFNTGIGYNPTANATMRMMFGR